MASRHQGALYIGVITDLIKRVWEHKNKLAKGHTDKYKIDKLVYYHAHDTIEAAILQEKKLKNWHRDWKINLIEGNNPEWKDLYDDLL